MPVQPRNMAASLLKENEFLHVSAGRLKTEDMEELFRRESAGRSFWMPLIPMRQR